jgi:hypothetical protein
LIVRSTLKSWNHVWSQDPALDRDADGFDEKWQSFLKTGDVRGLPVREGEKLAVLEIEPLNRKDYMRVLGMSGIEQFNEAVACGLRSVTNWEIDGVPLVLERKEDGNTKRLSVPSLDKIFDPYLFTELGLRILDVSRLDPLRARG